MQEGGCGIVEFFGDLLFLLLGEGIVSDTHNRELIAKIPVGGNVRQTGKDGRKESERFFFPLRRFKAVSCSLPDLQSLNVHK